MKHKNIPKGYKDSPLGIIPKEWEVKTIGEVCDIHVGKDLNLNSYSKICDNTHIYPVYSNTVDANGWYGGYYNFEEYKGNCVTVVGRGVGLGTAFYRDKGFGAIGRLLVLYSDKCDAKYLTEYINGKVEIFVESAAIPQLTGKQIANYRIAVPPIEEQRKISEILSVWDEAIGKQIKLIDALIHRKLAIIKLLLNQKKRLCDFREEWQEMKLGDCLKIGNGKDYKHLNTGDVPVLGTGGYMLSVNDYLYDGETVCIGRKGTIDKPIYHKGKIWTVDTLFYTHSYKNVIPLFIYYLFNLIDWQKYNEATGVPSLSKNTIENIPVFIPTLTEQIAIVEILTNADNEIELVKHKLKNIQVQKKGIMQKLLTGKTRI